MAGRREEHVLGDRVPALGEHDRGDLLVAPHVADLGLVEAMGRHDVQAESPQGTQVRLHGARPEVATPGIRELEGVELVQQRPEEHDDGARPSAGCDVDRGQVDLGRGDDLEVIAVGQPADLHIERGEHLDDAVDLFDPGEVAQGGTALVEQAGAEQADGGVLARLHRDRAGEFRSADDPQVLGTAMAEGDEL